MLLNGLTKCCIALRYMQKRNPDHAFRISYEGKPMCDTKGDPLEYRYSVRWDVLTPDNRPVRRGKVLLHVRPPRPGDQRFHHG
jgi:hypothetical protein